MSHVQPSEKIVYRHKWVQNSSYTGWAPTPHILVWVNTRYYKGWALQPVVLPTEAPTKIKLKCIWDQNTMSTWNTLTAGVGCKCFKCGHGVSE